jgi:hypothetical protein
LTKQDHVLQHPYRRFFRSAFPSSPAAVSMTKSASVRMSLSFTASAYISLSPTATLSPRVPSLARSRVSPYESPSMPSTSLKRRDDVPLLLVLDSADAVVVGEGDGEAFCFCRASSSLEMSSLRAACACQCGLAHTQANQCSRF